MKRPTSSFLQFRQRIPADVLSHARGTTLLLPVGDDCIPLTLSDKAVTVQVSLRTRDPRDAKARQGALVEHLGKVWQGLREGPRRLTHKETVALAGEAYGMWVGAIEGDPGKGETWWKVRGDNAEARAGLAGLGPLIIGDDLLQRRISMEARFGHLVDWCLGHRVLTVDDESRHRLLDRIAEVMDKAADRLSDNARGDYRQDQNAVSFPVWQDAPAPAPKAPAAPTESTLTGILAGWWVEGGARNLTLSTYEGYSATVAKLRAFLGHDDASRITTEDVIRFKDHRMASLNPRTGKPISLVTIKNNDLAGLKTVFGWALANRKLTINPAAGVTVKLAKRITTRSKGFTDAEANALLAAAFRYQSKGEGPKVVAAKRWVPWLCAYTGARVGEMVQLRREDVRQEGPHWVLIITPEAGTVKTKEVRVVALHPHLIEMGFVRFAQGSAEGHLFLKPSKTGDVRGPWRGVKNRLQMFARETVKDPGVAPSHGWRHRFKTVGRATGIDSGLLDRIVGHTPGSVGAAYGDFGVDVQLREISRMPRYPEG